MNSKFQRGVVLVVALVMLLVMTAVGVTLMSGATLQERMASNNRQLSLARMNAEAALRQAEIVLDNMNITTTANTNPRDVIATNFNPANDGRYVAVSESGYADDIDELVSDLSEAINWTTTNSVAAASTATSSTLPRYTIEYIGRLDHGNSDSARFDISVEKKDQQSTKPYVFRITAIGYGLNDDITAVLQSIYSTRANQ